MVSTEIDGQLMMYHSQCPFRARTHTRTKNTTQLKCPISIHVILHRDCLVSCTRTIFRRSSFDTRFTGVRNDDNDARSDCAASIYILVYSILDILSLVLHLLLLSRASRRDLDEIERKEGRKVCAKCMGALDRVLLRGLLFRGFHGVLPEERILGQEFRVDLALRTCLRTAQHETATVEDTVDYAAVHELVRDHVEVRPPKLLLEQLAGGICDDILAKHERVEEVSCRILKPQVAVKGIVLEGLGTRARTPRPIASLFLRISDRG